MTDDPILSTKDRIGDYDAIASAKPGEPLFGLQGGDPFAPNAIERWARLARQAALKMSDGEDRDKLLKKATAAELVAWKFREYYATTARGEAYEEDAPPAPTFASEDVTDRAVILARAADRLHNALAEAVTVAENVEALGESLLTVHAARIRDAADTLKDIAETIEPRRHMRRTK